MNVNGIPGCGSRAAWLLALGLLGLALSTTPARAQPDEVYDVVVYGGTSSGIAAALQAARMDKSVIIVEPGAHIGGMTTSGLGWTDSGDKRVIGGISREFYQRIKRHYEQPAAWTFQKPAEYERYRPDEDAMWTFEPHVAERVFKEWLAEHKIPVAYGERLDRRRSIPKSGSLPPQMRSIRTESGNIYRGRMFIDATYEGDLMAAAGVSFTVGREANGKYGETLNGVQKARNVHNHRFKVKVDPYVTPHDPESGRLPGIESGPYPNDGEGDDRLQAYCFRLCLSREKKNRVPFPSPSEYNETDYELLLRNFEAGDARFPMTLDLMPNGKTDTNNNGAVSTDFIGMNKGYAEASYEERERIAKAHEQYQKGLLWTLANHPRVPLEIREEMDHWGLAKDEFADNGNWPYQLYVREARRMVGSYVMTETDCRGGREPPSSIGMGSYNMDSHNCMRYVTLDGDVQNEGDVQESPGRAYRISYLAIVPKQNELANLLVPVCISSSHIAYGSVRMEPVFMVLGQSAATAAVLAIDDEIAVQDVSYEKLRARLLRDGQVLESPEDVR